MTRKKSEGKAENESHKCHYCGSHATSVAIKEHHIHKKGDIWTYILPKKTVEIKTVCDKHKEEHME